MSALRALIRSQRRLALLLLALSLAMKALLPAGFMLDAGNGAARVTLCGQGLDRAAGELFLAHQQPAPGHPGGAHDGDACPFATLTLAAVSVAAVALAAVAQALRAAPAPAVPAGRPRSRPPSHLRPPLRAPPVTA